MPNVHSKASYKKLKNIAIVILLAISVGYGVYFFLARPTVVPLKDSARPLKLNEYPSEEKPSQQQIAAYNAEKAEYPRKLQISRLGIAARIIVLDKDKNNTIESPANIFDVGWLKTTATSSDAEGFMVLDGHVQGTSADGVFKSLSTLKAGDGIVIQQQNGTETSFAVSDLKIIAFDEAAEKSLLAPPKNGVFELRLITCAGAYNKDLKTYDKRLVVTAIRK